MSNCVVQGRQQWQQDQQKAGADDGMNDAIMQNADGEGQLYEIIPQNADALLMAVSDRRGVRDE